MNNYFFKLYRPAMIGTAMEYYDVALYGYMAPILIQVFLPFMDKLSAYFYYFAFEVCAAICQMCGAYVIGKAGDKHGRKKALYYSIFGTCFFTFIISIIPTYIDIGIYAVILFALCRAMQSFFLGGEYNGGAIYCLEHERNHLKHGFVSGIYGALTVFGVLIAAIVATSIMHFGKEYFRVAYALSFVFALLTYYFRCQIIETPEFIASKIKKQSVVTSIFKGKTFFAIVLVSALSGIIYGLHTRIFNVILPIATGISSFNIMALNCIAIMLFMFSLIITGYISDYMKANIMIKKAIIAIIFLIIPMIALVETKFLIAIIIAKLIFIVLSAALIGPFHAWAQNISQVQNRYLQISVAYSLGKIIAIFILALTILLFEYYHSLLLPALFFLSLAIIAHKVLAWR